MVDLAKCVFEHAVLTQASGPFIILCELTISFMMSSKEGVKTTDPANLIFDQEITFLVYVDILYPRTRIGKDRTFVTKLMDSIRGSSLVMFYGCTDRAISVHVFLNNGSSGFAHSLTILIPRPLVIVPIVRLIALVPLPLRRARLLVRLTELVILPLGMASILRWLLSSLGP